MRCDMTYYQATGQATQSTPPPPPPPPPPGSVEGNYSPARALSTVDAGLVSSGSRVPLSVLFTDKQLNILDKGLHEFD